MINIMALFILLFMAGSKSLNSASVLCESLKKESINISESSRILISKLNGLVDKAKLMADESELLADELSLISTELNILSRKKQFMTAKFRTLSDSLLCDMSESQLDKIISSKSDIMLDDIHTVSEKIIINVSNLVGVMHKVEMMQMPFKDFMKNIMTKFGYNIAEIEKYAVIIYGSKYSIKTIDTVTLDMIKMADRSKKIHIINYL